MTDQRDTSVTTMTAATRPNALADGQLVLVGTMHGDSVGRALLRHEGKVHVLQAGDTLDRATVVAVSEGVVVLRHGTETVRLHLPGA